MFCLVINYIKRLRGCAEGRPRIGNSVNKASKPPTRTNTNLIIIWHITRTLEINEWQFNKISLPSYSSEVYTDLTLCPGLYIPTFS